MSDRRRFPRLAAPLFARPARMRRVDKQWDQQQQVLDASLGGIRIYSDDRHEVNKTLDLELILRDGSSVLCTARVAWLHELPKGGVALFEVGLAFTDVKPDALALLKTVLVDDDGDLNKQ
jgi:hypothetical protein